MEEAVFYFMNNLNDTIFGTVKANFMELSTRVLFPDTYAEIKQRIIAMLSLDARHGCHRALVSSFVPFDTFKILRLSVSCYSRKVCCLGFN